MRKSYLAAVLTVAAVLSGGVSARSGHDPASELARMIAGRTASAPVDCLRFVDIRSSRIIDGLAIVYEGRNGTLYVNRPASGASSLREGLVLVTDTHSDQLCSVDIVRLMDASTRMPTGSVGLGKFIPYSRPAHGNTR